MSLSCPKCTGLLVRDWVIDSGGDWPIHRCLNCGLVLFELEACRWPALTVPPIPEAVRS